jgi:putative SOS response-associated peptidase YedK
MKAAPCLFAFAGIWRLWTGERKGETSEHTLFAFLTTASNDVARPIHAKAMPVLLLHSKSLTLGLMLRSTRQLRCRGHCQMN